MLDAVRRVVEQALAPVPKDSKPVSVMERTGPGESTLISSVVLKHSRLNCYLSRQVSSRIRFSLTFK